MTAALQLTGICKSFPGVRALHQVDLEIKPGEVHALLGENGAGKSTLIKIITGAYALDSGVIKLAGHTVTPNNPAHAQILGISTLFQEINLLPNLSVAHNLFLGREPRKYGFIQWNVIHQRAKILLSRFKLNIDVRSTLSSHSVAVQQLVAIARAVDCSAQVLILDEPTASLDHSEVALLFAIVRELKNQGLAVVFVSHFLDQVYELSDRITVLRNGERVGTFITAELPRDQLIQHMLGRELAELEHTKTTALTKARGENLAVRAQQLTTSGGIKQVNFDVHTGEALGLAGLLGAGRSEICKALFGLDKITGGNLTLCGAPATFKNPAQAIKRGVALGPEERKSEGLIGPLSIRENIILALQAERGWWRPIGINIQRQLTQDAIAKLKIACPNGEKPVGELSGGNQQKVILARWLCMHPKILILDEPTRGIDIGAHAEILRLIRQLCRDGMTLLVASSEIEELVAFSDKVLVMRDRRQVALLENTAVTAHNIVATIAQDGGAP